MQNAARVAGLAMPDTPLAHAALELARSASGDMLFNHVMRSYWFAELFARRASARPDRELMFLAAVLHDLGLTERTRDPSRFEVAGANDARQFLLGRGVRDERAWQVWDIIALHTTDLNLYRSSEARFVQLGIQCDVVGTDLPVLAAGDVAELLAAYPRANFKREFFETLRRNTVRAPMVHPFHPCTMIEHHCCAPVSIPDARALIDSAPFAE